MRAVNDDFILQLRIRARHHGSDVELLDLAHRRLHFAAQFGGQRHRLEVLAFGGCAQRVQILAGGLEQRARGIVGHPALQLGPEGAGRQLEALHAGPAVLDHAPAVRRARRRMNQQHAGGALALGFLEFVSPAAIVRQALAVETVRLLGGRLRIVDHHDQDLAFEVGALVVVPLLVLRGDAVADEHQVRVEAVRGRRVTRREDPVLAKADRQRLAARFQFQRALGRQRLDAGDAHRLTVAVAVAGLQAQRQRLRFQIGDGQVGAALAGAAPFQQIAGQEGEVRAQWSFLHHGGGFTACRVCGESQRQADGQGGGNKGGGHFLHDVLKA